jgi:hypothetical protein
MMCLVEVEEITYGATRILIALSGSFDVVLKDGKSKK